ncbi:hypothetical protein ND861_10320 [Leptospira sp. 2 VSF19]|uniref:DUF91 domain-containing protein n=1 Tax=Leptospira soteropolitanensis TaxID=2950025 RepID=A0AAW5VQM1_9LEPT|nr:hypothetical protein [Leptospira soteropolitanensis]MCW7493301.1 hypothetical protein [Leptospira soteropolitanensis]MCW7500630.1 hypothetical protein [Leptospira soteropolitanensis]MCW7523151.1 hypothetical protein [Leptospira soteropolitanensis]MCW7526742.1 hypothetical protein [Leptospira soteropolitanensis]MCW7530869.1 hypothetical protein [Leptospira soteropolitanensis]
MKDYKETRLTKDFIVNSTEISEIKTKIESSLNEVDLSFKFHFKNFNTLELKFRESSSNYVIDEHEKNDPKLASEKCDWNEEHWTKVVDLLHREKFRNFFWDSEIPIDKFGKIDLLLANNEVNNTFTKITIIEAKTSQNAREGLRHALYYSHLLHYILKKSNRNYEISFALLIVPKDRQNLSKEKLKLLKEDSNDIKVVYNGYFSDIKVIEMISPGSLPDLIPSQEVIIPPNINFIYHPVESDLQIKSSSLSDFF